WLERDGSMVPGSSIIDVSIYDGNDRIKRKTTVVDAENSKHYYYEGIPDSVKLWIGDRFGEVRVIADVIADCATYYTGEIDTPPDFAGFFIQRWTPTDYSNSTDTYPNLQAGKVYASVSYICIATGASFRTPASFTVTTPIMMDEMSDTIEYVLDKPLSEVDAGIQLQLSTQFDLIESTLQSQTETLVTTLDDQTIAIGTKLDEQTTAIETTLTSFEESVADAISDLETGAADIAVAGAEMRLAGEEFEETARRYSGRLILPTSILQGEPLNVRYRVIGAGAIPIMDIYNHDDELLIGSQVLSLVSGVEELYSYDVSEEDSQNLFTGGKAITIMVTEAQSGNLEVGSVMVETMSLSAVAGLASAAPKAASLIQEALDTIGAVRELISIDAGETNKALEKLQNTVEFLPKVIAKEIAKGQTGVIARQVDDIATQLNILAGDEGYDLSTMLEKKLSESPTIIEIRTKTDNIKGAVSVMRDIVQQKLGGTDEPIISTSFVTE
ncbi:MAG: hypothetical protein KAI70_06105, partial [Candidatus Omnitrophica bacterium]|nr:hypothetical protein [Candidatus Omnitrophota bacterium]